MESSSSQRKRRLQAYSQQSDPNPKKKRKRAGREVQRAPPVVTKHDQSSYGHSSNSAYHGKTNLEQSNYYDRGYPMNEAGPSSMCSPVHHYVAPPTKPRVPQTRGPKRKRAHHGRGMKRVKRKKQLQHVMQLSVEHQVSSLVNNDFLVAYLKTSSSDFESVSAMMKLFDNTLFCDNDTLNKRAQTEVLPKIFEYGGFLEAVRYHLCCLPRRANDQVRGSSVLFIERLCKLFFVWTLVMLC